MISMSSSSRSASLMPLPVLEVGRERRVDEHEAVDLGDVLGEREAGHGDRVEEAERVALGEQVLDRALVQRAGDDQHDVVDHVAVADVLEELLERLGRLHAHCGDLLDELLRHLLENHRRSKRRLLVGQKVAVAGGGEVKFDVF
jgi:hypothetical protein